MKTFLSLVGIVFGCLLVYYREQVGMAFGDPPWASKVGGVYNVVIIIGIFFVFWSLATLTNTTDVLFAPIFMFLPHKIQDASQSF